MWLQYYYKLDMLASNWMTQYNTNPSSKYYNTDIPILYKYFWNLPPPCVETLDLLLYVDIAVI